jgi:putative membrane protein insertion efficiency factor
VAFEISYPMADCQKLIFKNFKGKTSKPPGIESGLSLDTPYRATREPSGTLVRKIIVFPLQLYKMIISPLLPKACIYTPSCSDYTREAILKFGFLKGFLLGTTRLFRCNSLFFIGGNDPVPELFSFHYVRQSYRDFYRGKHPAK